ncbi:MAG: ThiF family adenylyltransferase, partial [Bacteroidota bacterium]
MDNNREQQRRYHRQVILPQVGPEGQRRIMAARVLVIGAGGLGSPLLAYLAAAGTGTIGIVDFDAIDETNLHRQILFKGSETGTLKTVAAEKRLRELNPDINIRTHNIYVNSDTILPLLEEYDIIADGSDNLPTRYLLNDACVLSGKPLVYGAIHRFEGQAGVFNVAQPDGSRSSNYRDLYPAPPPPELVPSCQEGGVLGPLAGIIGSMMALEVLKLAGGFGEPLVNRICLFDGIDLSTRYLNVLPDRNRNPITRLEDYEEFCNPRQHQKKPWSALTPKEAQALLRQNKATLIDVREPEEFSRARIGGINIPLGSLTREAQRIPRKTAVILVCRTGNRSE